MFLKVVHKQMVIIRLSVGELVLYLASQQRLSHAHREFTSCCSLGQTASVPEGSLTHLVHPHRHIVQLYTHMVYQITPIVHLLRQFT